MDLEVKLSKEETELLREVRKILFEKYKKRPTVEMAYVLEKLTIGINISRAD